MSAREPTTIDQHVGARLRLRRNTLDLSQTELGNRLGITFQQIQKYERGTNRIGASRLFNVARVLDVPVAYFFDGLNADGVAENQERSDTLYDFIASPDGIDLATAFSAIDNPNVRKQAIELLRALAD